MRLLALLLSFILAAPVFAQSVETGPYVRSDFSDLTNPTQGSTWVYNSTDLNLYVRDYSGNWQARTLPQFQLAGIGAPTVSTDRTAGYAVGSLYFDTSGKNLYVCTDATAGAAVWSIINNRSSAIDIANAVQGKLSTMDFCSDYLVSGTLAPTSANLTTSTGSLVAYVSSLRQFTTASSYTYTASKDTYDYLQSNGTWLHVAVANGASAPTGQTGLAIQKVVSSASAITSVTQLANNHPVVSVSTATGGTYNAIPINQADGRYCASAGSYSANQFYASPIGSSGAISLRNLSASDILFNLPVSVGGLGAPVVGAVGSSLVGNGGSYSEVGAPSGVGSWFWQNAGGGTASYWAAMPIVSAALGGTGAANTPALNTILMGNGTAFVPLTAPPTPGQFLRNVSAGIGWSPGPTGSLQLPYWTGSDYNFTPTPTTANTCLGYNGTGFGYLSPLFTIDRTTAMGGVSNSRPLPCNAPAAPTITHGGTTGSTSYSYAVAAVMPDNLTLTTASPATANATGNATLSSTNTNIISWTAVTGAAAYAVYRTAAGGSPSTVGYIGSVVGTTFTDTGIAAATGVLAPTAATLTGDYYNGVNYTQNQPFYCTNTRIYNAGTLTFAGVLVVNPTVAGGTALTNAAMGANGAGLGGGAGGSIVSAGGGAGGGFGGSGGKGGYLTSSAYIAPPSNAYSITQSLSGSGGGAGNGTGTPGSGGNGCGPFYIESTGPIIFSSTSAVSANGANGTTATANGGGGGGGSGGGIDIRCTSSVTISTGATMTANGGNGGASIASGPGGGSGAAGSIQISGVPVTNNGTISCSPGTVSAAGSSTTIAGVGASSVPVIYSFAQGPRSSP